jgi:hypothetical protein
MRGVRVVGRSAFTLVFLALTSCAVVDLYADRATQYNVEAEQAQEKTILLNIVRASLRRPLQFTTVTSIIGSTSATGSGGFSAPVNVPFRSSGGAGSYPALSAWSAGASLNGSETFTVPVLDTQEFYQGILKPVPSQFYDFLVQQRYPPDFLFNLLIQKVVIRDTDKKCAGKRTEECEHVFANYVSLDSDIVPFQMFAHFLIRAGLSTEAVDRKDSPLKGAMNINLKLLGSTGQAAASGQSSGATSGGSPSGESPTKNYAFCFAARDRQHDINRNGGCGAPDNKSTFEEGGPSSVTVHSFAKTTKDAAGQKVVRIPALPE